MIINFSHTMPRLVFLHLTSPCYTTPHYTTSHHNTPHHNTSHHTTIHHTPTYHNTTQHTTPHCTTPNRTPPHHNTTHHNTTHHITPQHTAPQHTTLHHTTTQHTTLHHSTPHYTTTQHNTPQYITSHHNTPQHTEYICMRFNYSHMCISHIYFTCWWKLFTPSFQQFSCKPVGKNDKTISSWVHIPYYTTLSFIQLLLLLSIPGVTGLETWHREALQSRSGCDLASYWLLWVNNVLLIVKADLSKMKFDSHNTSILT